MTGYEPVGFAAVTGLLIAWNKHRNVSKNDCEKQQAKCSTALCDKIDELKHGQGIQIKEMKEIKFFMGRVHQFMKDHNNAN